MKISKIKISKFHQFEDFELDLTYPKGHEKEGKPLDKVCLIGQSGTGKTTLLEMIETATMGGLKTSQVHPDFFETRNAAYFTFMSFQGPSRRTISLLPKGQYSSIQSPNVPVTAELLIHFPSGISNFVFNNEIPENGTSKVEEPSQKYGKENLSGLFKLDRLTLEKTWKSYYEKIKEYKKESINVRLKFFNEEKGNEKFREWEKANPNPTEKVARECLNILLNKLSLAVKTEIDDVGEKDILPIKSLNENAIIPYEHLSTGTKQIIFTAFPIYQLLQDDSIILMDEPETSLYPDIQREIIPYYTSFDKEKKSQFFFATHSPIIASSFEPWEIVELKFDEKGKVYRDKYYEGENHVDNYKIDPRYLRWDDILTKVFDLPVDSNAEFRSKKLMEYAILKDKIQKLRSEGGLNNPEAQEVVEEFEKAYNLITGNWAVTRHEKN